MKHKKRSVFYLPIAALLLFFVVLFVACNDGDFYDQYGTPQTSVSVSDASSTDAATDAVDASTNDDETDTSNQSGEIADDQTGSDDGAIDNGEGVGSSDDQTSDNDQTSDDTIADGDGADEQEEDSSDEEGPVILPPSGDTTDDLEDFGAESPDYSEIFDLKNPRHGLYRYIFFEDFESDLTVYVGTERIGTASITASGKVRFDCGFVVAERELWGAWDEADNVYSYVLLEEFSEEFRQINLRFSVLQIDMTLAEAESLRPEQPETTEDGDLSEEEQGEPTSSDDAPTADPDPASQGDPEETEQEEQGGENPQAPTSDPQDEPQEPTADEDTPTETDADPLAESDVSFLWEGIGTACDVQIVLLTDEEEEYRMTLVGTAAEYTAFKENLHPYVTSSGDGVATEVYEAQVVLDDMIFNLFVQIARNGDSFVADIKVLGEAL